MPRSRGNSGNADPGWRTVFVTFISRQVRANIAHFLPEFECNARIIRIELDRGRGGETVAERGVGSKTDRDSFFFGFWYELSEFAYLTLKITPFHGRLRHGGCASRVMRKVWMAFVTGFSGRRASLHANSEIFHPPARATVFRDFARRSELGSRPHGILPAVIRYSVRIVVIRIIRIDLSL